MAIERVVMPLASISSARTAEAIRSPARALVGLSVVSGFGITVRIARNPAGDDPRQGEWELYHIGLRFANPARVSRSRSPLTLAEQALELGPHRRRQIAAFERIGDVGGKKTHLRAAVEAPAFEFQAMERLGLG